LPCDDGNACTDNDKCGAGICAGVAKVCNDADPCTFDTCNPTAGCLFSLANAFSFQGQKFFLCTAARTWESAQTYCVSKGYHLATIPNAATQATVVNAATGISAGKVWIGFNDRGIGNEGKFTWVSGAPVTYSTWCPGEPNNSILSGGEDCVEINGCSSGAWNDRNCGAQLPFLCSAAQ
jgi:hypothetical protein